MLLRLSRVGAGATSKERAETLVAVFRAISSPGYPFPEEWARRVAQISDERAPRDPSTTQRQLAAGRAHPSRPLETITAPTLVISGTHDPLVRWTAGRDTAARIPGATFIRYAGMGHSLPEELLDQVVEQVRQATAQA